MAKTQTVSDEDFWSQAWLEAFREYDETGGLNRAAAASRKPDFEVSFRGRDGISAWTTKGRYCHTTLRYTRAGKPKNFGDFLDALAKRPDLVAPIFNGKLPVGVAELCEKFGVDFIPKSRRAVASQCTCGQARVDSLCRHQMMCVQWMADQIRKEPLTLFALRGINLKEELEARGLKPTQDSIRIPILSEHVERALERVAPISPEERAGRTPEQILRTIPYGHLGRATVVPESLLPATVDYAGVKNFGEWVEKCRDRTRRWWMKLQKSQIELLKAEPGSPEMLEVRTEFEKDVWRGMLPETKYWTKPPRPKKYDFWFEGDNVASRDEVAAFFAARGLKTEEALVCDYPIAETEAASVRLAKRLKRWMPGVRGLKLSVHLNGEATLVEVTVEGVDWDMEGVEPTASLAETDRLLKPIPFEHFLSALLHFTAQEAAELDPVCEAWREIAVFAAHLVSNGWTIPQPFLPDHLPEAMVRVLMFPTVTDPHVAKTTAYLAAAVEPVCDRLLRPFADIPTNYPKALQSGPGTRLDTRLAHAHRLVLTALAFASSAVLRVANPKELSDRSFLGERLVFNDNLCHYDGLDEDSERLNVFRSFQPMVASALFPFRPVVMLVAYEKKRRGRKKADEPAVQEFGLNFGIVPKAGNGRIAADADPVTLHEVNSEAKWEKIRFAANQAYELVCRLYPALAELGAHPKEPVALSNEAMAEFLYERSALLSTFGMAVGMPEELRRMVRPRLVAQIGTPKPPASGKRYLSKEALQEFEWQVAIGDHTVDADTFLKLAKDKGKIVPIGGSYVYLDPAMVDDLVRSLKSAKKPDYFEKYRAALMGDMEGAEVRVTDVVKDLIRSMVDAEDRPVPAALTATLRPYQERGYSWMMKNIDLGLGSLIADDMGLGKTLQVIAALTALKEDGRLCGPQGKHALVVAPISLLTNWVREIERFSPSLTTGIYHGQGRRWPDAGEGAPDIILTTYGTLRSDAELFADKKLAVLVIDEAQAVKNHLSGQAKAVRMLKADHVIAMTGTPVENRLMEYWSIFEILQPKLLGPAAEFQRRIATPIELDHDAETLERFKKLTAPFMIRRTKDDKTIITDLPERTTIDTFTSLTAEQTRLYQAALNESFGVLNRIQDEAIEKKRREGLAMNSGAMQMKRRGEILKLIGELKAICNSPAQYEKTFVPTPDSGKGESLIELLERLHDAQRKVIIFTQFRSMGELLQTWIERATGVRPDFLHGGVSRSGRQAMVDRFQTDRSVRVIIVSLKAGGTGLNLTAASAVIHYDLWWNPAVEQQATDRAYRIGQRRDVLVYRFVTEGTFEEKINTMLIEKRELADLTVSTGETWIGDLPEEGLREFLSLTDRS